MRRKIKYGDVYVRPNGGKVKVMACVDGYVLYRWPGCSPIILRKKTFLAAFQEAPQDTKETKRAHAPNSAMDAIALATKFLDSNPHDVDTRVVVADFVKFVREQQHQ